MIDQDMLQNIVGHHAYDRNGEKVGKVGQVYVDDHDGSPVWATINTGLFGMTETFVPLHSADVRDHDLRLAVTKDQVRDAPRIENAHEHLDEAEQSRLDRYYGRWTGADHADTREGMRDGTRADSHDASRNGMRGGQEMTRSEERLRVGTESYESGRARLRKYVVTENQTVTVPVTHEEVRIEREAVRDSVLDVGRPATIGEDTQEVTLHAERPVVDKRVEAVERVRMGVEQVTEDHTVSEDLRKEQIDVDDDRRTPRH